jgi:Flp pilus assembly protein TadG
MRLLGRRAGRGQALTEFAMVFPLFLLLLFSMIVFGLYVFYNQQLENAAREAARYAALHSSTAQCPTVSQINPVLSNQPDTYHRCDAPENGWPRMTDAARSSIFGMASNQVSVTACWSGLVDANAPPNADVLPSVPTATQADCTMNGVNPQTDQEGLACPAPATVPSLYPRDDAKADGDDKASSIAVGVGTGAETHYPTTVTVYACFRWTPPLSGFIFIPNEIILKAVVTEALQRQQ